jgi:hypothetical protein
MARISAAPLRPFSEARRNAIAIEPQPNRVKREKKTHHEGHEVHEERMLTTKGAKSFQSEISKNLRVLRDLRGKDLFLEYYLHD